jgi:8-oxo-dGTP pyrophosphatase MutT (NUDIX family)
MPMPVPPPVESAFPLPSGSQAGARSDQTAVLPWDVESSQTLLENRLFRLRRDRSRSRLSGQPHEFFVLDAPDWVNVVPITEAGEAVLIRQYRHGTREATLEIPGGMVEPDDPDPAVAAARELREETGYVARELRPLGSIAPNPAILSNRCHSFVALGANRAGPPSLDGEEEIDVLRVPLCEVPRLIADGQISHALVVVAFCHLLGLGPTTRAFEEGVVSRAGQGAGNRNPGDGGGERHG